MTDAGYDFDRFVANGHKPGSVWRFGSVSWIPAFAGMTEGAGHHFMQALQLLAKQHHAACPHHPGGNDPVASSPKLS